MIILEKPGRLDLECVQGDTFQRSCTIQDGGSNVNLTGNTGSFVAILDTVGSPKIEITNATGLTFGNGTFTIAIDDSVTLGYKPGNYTYQWRTSDATDTQTLLEGNFLVKERRQ